MNIEDIEIGMSVKFTAGLVDEESGVEIGGWQGRVKEIDLESQLVRVDLDSITLKSLPRYYLEIAEIEGLGWESYYAYPSDFTRCDHRDAEKDVDNAIFNMTASLGWIHLGEEGREINRILRDTLTEPVDQQFNAFLAHLQRYLKFPFKAVVSEWQEPGSEFRSGNKVTVTSIHHSDSSYGLVANLKSGSTILLADLESVPKKGKNYDLVHLYAVWYANRH